MSSEVFSLSLLNLALDGSLDLFVDLYKHTYDAYLGELLEVPWYIHDQRNFNSIMIPKVLPEFDSLAFKRLRLFTTKVKKIQLYPHHFKYFDFFSPERIKEFQFHKLHNQMWKNCGFDSYDIRYLEHNNELFEFQETVVDLQEFVTLFKKVIGVAIYEEMLKENTAYSVFDARKDMDARISERMKMRRNECIVPNSRASLPTPEPLVVFDSLNNTGCKINHHSVASKKYYAKHIDGKNTIALPVHYCKTCNRHMIGSLSLSLFKEYCGEFIAQIIEDIPGCRSGWRGGSESKLHQMGYNVINGKLTAAERQCILISIVETKHLTWFEVIATIEQNIRIFENNPRMQAAVKKWRNDLRFANEYMLNRTP